MQQLKHGLLHHYWQTSALHIMHNPTLLSRPSTVFHVPPRGLPGEAGLCRD